MGDTKPPVQPTDEKKLEDVRADSTDPYLERAVDEIVHGESDQLLEAKDDEIARAFEPNKSRWQQLKDWFAMVWAEPRYRNTLIAGVVLFVSLIFVIPITRWGLLNTLGFRASASLKVTDDKTTQPVKNAVVTLRGKTMKTDDNGEAKLDHLKLGPASLKIKKTAYAEVSQTVKLGLGSNDLGGRTLTAVGARLKFRVIDWLSKKPINKAEASLGESSAFANEEGVVEMPLEPTDAALQVSITADHYLSKKVDSSLADASVKEVNLVTDYPDYFVSNRSGKFDLYRSNADGSAEKLIMAGTGRESNTGLLLSMSPDRKHAAYVSKRDNEKNADGYLLESLNLFDTSTDTAKKLAASEEIYLVGWDDEHLVYVKTAAGASAANSQRQRLISYDFVHNKERELATSNYFVSAVMIKDFVYYTPSDVYTNAKRGIFRSKTDGSDKLNIYTNDTWAVFRTDWDTLTFQTSDKWYKYVTNNAVPQKLDAAPANAHSVDFVDNGNHSKTLWYEERDGKGTLLIRSTDDKQDTVLRQQSGLRSIVGWAGDKYVVYRVAIPSETANYIVNIDGGSPVKIKDVFNVDGIKARY